MKLGFQFQWTESSSEWRSWQSSFGNVTFFVACSCDKDRFEFPLTAMYASNTLTSAVGDEFLARNSLQCWALLFCSVLGLNLCDFRWQARSGKKCKLGNAILKYGDTTLETSVMMIDEACTECDGSSFVSVVVDLLSDYTASHLERHRWSVSTEITREYVSKANKKTHVPVTAS